MTRLIITTARSFLASKNPFKLTILDFGYLGHQIGSFSVLRSIHIYVGQINVNHNSVKCQMSMKLSAMCDQNPSHILDQIVAKLIPMKNDLKP